MSIACKMLLLFLPILGFSQDDEFNSGIPDDGTPGGSSITQDDLRVGPSASDPRPNRKAVRTAAKPLPSVRKHSPREKALDHEFDRMWDLKHPEEIVESFDFPDADIMDLIKAISKMTRKNVIMDPKVGGKITIITQVAITVRDAFKVFLTALTNNNYTVVRSGEFLRVVRLADAREMNHPVVEGDKVPDADTMITRVTPIKNVSSEEVLRNIRALTNKEARIFNLAQTNTLIIVETSSNMQRILKMISLLDREGFVDSPGIIQVQNTQASEIQKLLQAIIGGGANRTNQRPGGTSGTSTAGRSFGGSAAAGPRITDIIADDRTNSLIVLANEKGFEKVQELVQKLDIKSEFGAGQIHIYYLVHADAESVSKTLGNLVGGTGGGGTASTGGTARRAFGAQGELTFEGKVKVAADKDTNSLVVTAKQADYDLLSPIIGKLDMPRDQVFVEALVMEMTLDRNFSYSPNILGVTGDKSFNRAGFITNPDDLVKLLTSPQSIGGVFLGNSMVGPVREMDNPYDKTGSKLKLQAINGMIKALQTVTDANIRATPSLLAFDNQESKISVKEQVPFKKTTTNATGQSSSSIEKEAIGLELTLKPRINKASDFVKLDIEFGLDDFTKRELAEGVKNEGGVATVARKIKTSVSVKDSDTVAFGGLIRDIVNESKRQIPILGDIPLLGWLFKSSEQEVRKQNLMVFITPRIIKQYDRMRAILNDKISERDEFVSEMKGGKDPFKKARDKIVGGLERLEGTPSNNLLKEGSNTGPTSSIESAPVETPENPTQLPSFGE